MAEVSLELLQSMMQQVLDGMRMLREDVASIRRRLGRVEQGVLALQRAQVDRAEDEAGMQEQLDALTRRIERLESRAG